MPACHVQCVVLKCAVCLFCRLNNPTATVYGFDANNTGHAVILTLSNPTANSADKVSLTALCAPSLCLGVALPAVIIQENMWPSHYRSIPKICSTHARLTAEWVSAAE